MKGLGSPEKNRKSFQCITFMALRIEAYLWNKEKKKPWLGVVLLTALQFQG